MLGEKQGKENNSTMQDEADEWFSRYQREYSNQISNTQQMYAKYQNVIKLHQQFLQSESDISEQCIMLILEQDQKMNLIARELQKEGEYNAIRSQLVTLLSKKSESSKLQNLKDEIQYYMALSFYQEKNFKKATEVYQKIIKIYENKVPPKWIPLIIETYKKQNDYSSISSFCLCQQIMRDKISEGLDYYLLLNIMNKKVDLTTISQFMENNNIHSQIDFIISNFQDETALYELYLQSAKLYLARESQYVQAKEFEDQNPQNFFYSLLQSYANVIKLQSYPSSFYVGFLMQLKFLSKEEEKDNINLEIAKTYQDMNEVDLSISYFEKYLLKQPNNLGIVFDLYYQYQSSEKTNIHKQMYDFFKILLINNPHQTVYYGILIQDNNMSFKQLKLLIQEYLEKNIKHYQYLFKFIDFISNTIFTQNSFFNNRDLLKSFIKFQLENANAIYQRAVYYKQILPFLTYQPLYSLNDLYFN